MCVCVYSVTSHSERKAGEKEKEAKPKVKRKVEGGAKWTVPRTRGSTRKRKLAVRCTVTGYKKSMLSSSRRVGGARDACSQSRKY